MQTTLSDFHSPGNHQKTAEKELNSIRGQLWNLIGWLIHSNSLNIRSKIWQRSPNKLLNNWDCTIHENKWIVLLKICDYFNPFQPSVAFHIVTSHLIFFMFEIQHWTEMGWRSYKQLSYVKLTFISFQGYSYIK